MTIGSGVGANQYQRHAATTNTSRNVVDPRFVDMCGSPTPEETVGFAFQYPEWAAAGFSREDRDLWMTAGFEVNEAAAWAASSVNVSGDAAQWRVLGFEPDHVNGWVQSGWGPIDAATWYGRGFTVEEADRWIAAGVHHPDDLEDPDEGDEGGW